MSSPSYAPSPVAGRLAGTALCTWDASFQGAHVLVPDACVELMWLEGRGVVVCGPETSAWSFEYAQPRHASGVRIRPGLAGPLWRTPLDGMHDRVVDYADLVGSRRARLLSDEIEARPAGARSARLLAEVDRLHGGPDPAAALPAYVASAMMRRSAPSVIEVARELDVSDRHLRRQCDRWFGYRPTTLRSILRLQRFLRLAALDGAMSLATLAAMAGYADQAHLTRESRRRSGQTPTALLASAAPRWHGPTSPVDL